jgi:hypothetical protein
MKKHFAGLSDVQQEKVEAEYHRMKRDEFDETMAREKTCRVDESTLNEREDTDNELAQMAADPDIERELREIEEPWA